MAGSRAPGPHGKDPWNPSPRTPGPLGTNYDAADPDSPRWFTGDTPGPLGHNDYADQSDRTLLYERPLLHVQDDSGGTLAAGTQPAALPQKDPNYLLVLLEEFHNESIVMACFV